MTEKELIELIELLTEAHNRLTVAACQTQSKAWDTTAAHVQAALESLPEVHDGPKA